MQQSPAPEIVFLLGSSASGHDRLTRLHQAHLLQLATKLNPLYSPLTSRRTLFVYFLGRNLAGAVPSKPLPRCSPPQGVPLVIRPSLDSTAGSTAHMRGGKDVGAQSIVRRTFSGPTEQAGTSMPLARCPVGGRPIGRCTSWIPVSASSCSLRCSSQLHFPFGNYSLIFRTSAFRQSARNTGLDFPRFPPVSASNALRFPFWELTQIPVHGYDSRSGPFPALPTKGRPCASSHKGHGAPPLCFSHSIAVRPTVTAHCRPARARRREQ